MKSQILVPLDGSAFSEAVLPHAAALARLTSSSLTLLRAIPAPVGITPVLVGATPPLGTTWDIWDEELVEARAGLDDLARDLRLEGLSVATKIVDELPANAIVRYADDNPDVALIAMATHGRSGLSRLVLGSVAEKVLHAVSKPLLLVRPPKKGDGDHTSPAPKYDKITVTLDGSHFAEQALEQAKSLAADCNATLALITTIYEPANLSITDETLGPQITEDVVKRNTTRMSCYLLDIARRLEAEGFKARPHLVHGQEADMILKVCDKIHTDLIVMATHGRSGLQRMWLGSVAMKVVQGSTLPVLLVRPTDAR